MTSETEPTAAGWDAIEAACQSLYGEQVPRHVGYAPGRAFGSVLQGCSAYRAEDHWHYVTYGLSNIFDDDEGENDGFSGWGYELTWRVRDLAGGEQPPGWPFTILQRLAKWAAEAPVLLEEGTRLRIGGPVTGFPHTDGPDTDLTGILLAADPQLGQISTVNGACHVPPVRRRRCRRRRSGTAERLGNGARGSGSGGPAPRHRRRAVGTAEGPEQKLGAFLC
ncbi:suppressor of fused domain protein [Cellulomonas sp. URHE0023]|uniref:suppressor of fused domain protein n=1 Tax=Cellulomonas sp. URHE0023 TaxID=1380354 RepID=UPI000484F384|nr:suppressor of fused domain protein [Cellulomonas sp. URHE0023]